MTLTEWRRAHAGWNGAAMFLGVMAGITLSHDVTENLLLRLLVSCAMCVAITLGLPAMAWFFAPDGRGAQP